MAPLGVLAAAACFPTLTPFNEPIAPPAGPHAANAVTEAPADGELSTPYAPHPLTDKIVQYARGYCAKRQAGAAGAGGDAGTVTRDYAPDALIRSPGEPDRRGLAAIAATWNAQAELLTEAKCPGPQVFVQGGTSVLLSAAVGKNTGMLFGFEPTGRSIGVPTATVDVFTPDGKIIEEREYVDAPTLLFQLGVYDKPARGVTVPAGGLECHLATGSPDERANAVLVRHMQYAFEKHDARAYAAPLADDVVWDDFTAPAPIAGKRDVMKRFDALSSAFARATLDCEPRGVVDYVVSECTLTGLQTGPLVVAGMTAAPTNRDVTVHTLEIVQLRDHKVVKGWTYGNGRELASELGIWNPAPPAPAPAPPASPSRDGGVTDASAARD